MLGGKQEFTKSKEKIGMLMIFRTKNRQLTSINHEKMQLFKIYASRGGSCVGNSPPTTPDQIEGDHKQCCPPCSKSIGPFLARTASQSQRGGSIINMKGTERDRSKAGINKGV